MRAKCLCIYCPKHPKWGQGLVYDHYHIDEQLEAEVECFEPDDEEFYEIVRDRRGYSDTDTPRIEYADGFAYASELGDNFVACMNEEYKEK